MDILENSAQITMLFVGLAVIAIFILVKVFYLLTLQKTLEQVAPERREMTTGQVWLELIPLFGIVWQFFNVNRVMRSVENEFKARDMSYYEISGTTNLGKASCILSCCGIIPIIGGLIRLASIICWIIFWVKTSNLKKQLENYQLYKIEHIK